MLDRVTVLDWAWPVTRAQCALLEYDRFRVTEQETYDEQTGCATVRQPKERTTVVPMGLQLRRELLAIFLLTLLCGYALAADGSNKNAAADRVEALYNSLPAGTDAAGHEGYYAAEKAMDQLKLDFIAAFQNPQRNVANQTVWQQEEAQLISDSLKYGGDRTLDAAAMYWGLSRLTLPVMGRDDLLAQARAMKVGDQPGEREFNEYIADYLAARFDSLSKLASRYRSAGDAIEGRDVPLYAEALQTELSIDELDRTGRPYVAPAPAPR